MLAAGHATTHNENFNMPDSLSPTTADNTTNLRFTTN